MLSLFNIAVGLFRIRKISLILTREKKKNSTQDTRGRCAEWEQTWCGLGVLRVGESPSGLPTDLDTPPSCHGAFWQRPLCPLHLVIARLCYSNDEASVLPLPAVLAHLKLLCPCCILLPSVHDGNLPSAAALHGFHWGHWEMRCTCMASCTSCPNLGADPGLRSPAGSHS